MPCKKSNSTEQIVNPAPGCSQVPFWFWNGELDPNQLRQQVGGSVFQGRYKAFIVEDDKPYIGKVTQYLHLNPVRTRAHEDKELDVRRESTQQRKLQSWCSLNEVIRAVERVCDIPEKELLRTGYSIPDIVTACSRSAATVTCEDIRHNFTKAVYERPPYYPGRGRSSPSVHTPMHISDWMPTTTPQNVLI